MTLYSLYCILLMHTDALGQKVDEMRRGRSAVLECGHTLVLGWSEKIFCLLDEMCQV